jgi:hypothetical protein
VNNANPQLTVRTAGSTTSLTGFNPTFAANGTYTVLVSGTTAAPVYTTLDDAFTTPGAGQCRGAHHQRDEQRDDRRRQLGHLRQSNRKRSAHLTRPPSAATRRRAT